MSSPTTLARPLAALIVFVVATCLSSLFARDTRNVEHYQTRIGEQRPLPQPDGSVITLNTDSSIDLRHDGPTIYVQISGGEVHFNMTPSRHGHLVVSVAGVDLLDTGTIFNVRVIEQGARVTVKEGQVTVSIAHVSRVDLHASQQAIIDTHSTVMAIRAHDITSREVDRQLSWLQGYLDFQCDTLASAAREFNRYSLTHIEVMDEPTAKIRIGGMFSTTDPITFAEAMAKVMPNIHLDSVQSPDGTRTLRLRQALRKGPLPTSGCAAALNPDE